MIKIWPKLNWPEQQDKVVLNDNPYSKIKINFLKKLYLLIVCVEVRGQTGGIGSPLPPCVFCCSNTGHWPWPQVHLTIFAGPKLKNYESILTNKWLNKQMNGEEHTPLPCRKIPNVSHWVFLPQGQGLAINAQLWVACTLWFLLRNMARKGWSGEKRVTFGRN